MTRDKLIEILTEVFSDTDYSISPERGDKDTGSFYVKRWSDKLNQYSPVFKIFTYAGKSRSGWKISDDIIWYIHLNLDNDTKEFLIPDLENEHGSESITKDFLKVFKVRVEEYLIVKREHDNKLNDIMKLKKIDIIQSEIRDFKLDNIGV